MDTGSGRPEPHHELIRKYVAEMKNMRPLLESD